MQHPSDRYLDVGGLRIHYLEWGARGRQPLVLLHGIARVAHTFDHIAPHFADRYHVIAVDLRGHGDSAWDPRGAYMVEDYTRDVDALMTHLELTQVVLWGNSTGGRVAQVLAGARPERIAAVIVEDVGPERPSAIAQRRAERMAREQSGWDSIDALMKHAAAESPRMPRALLEAFVRHGSMRRADGRIVWKRDPAILNGFVPTELWDSVRRIESPILYIVGGASTIVPALTRQTLSEVLPHAQIVEMPGLGHYPSDEQPEAFAAVVDRFLAAAAGAGAPVQSASKLSTADAGSTAPAGTGGQNA